MYVSLQNCEQFGQFPKRGGGEKGGEKKKERSNSTNNDDSSTLFGNKLRFIASCYPIYILYAVHEYECHYVMIFCSKSYFFFLSFFSPFFFTSERKYFIENLWTIKFCFRFNLIKDIEWNKVELETSIIHRWSIPRISVDNRKFCYLLVYLHARYVKCVQIRRCVRGCDNTSLHEI